MMQFVLFSVLLAITSTVCLSQDICLSYPPVCKTGLCVQGTQSLGSYICVDSYEGSSTDSCSDDPCVNGTCTSNAEDYNCTCDDGFMGRDCSIPDPCKENTCNMNGNCTASANGMDFNCTCNENYSGKTCNILSCPETTIDYNDETIHFGEAQSGEGSSSNATCPDGEFSGKSIGIIKCNATGHWEDPDWINCTAQLSDMDPEEQVTTIEVITTNPSAITQKDVTVVVDTISSVSESENIKPQTVDSIVATVDNLLKATDNEALEEVTKQSQVILESLSRTNENVELSKTTGNTDSSVTIDLTLAMNAIKDTSLTRASNPLYFGFTKGILKQDSFSDLNDKHGMATEVPDDVQVYVQLTTAGERGNFQAFQSDSLFPEGKSTGEIDSIIFRSDSTGESQTVIQFNLFTIYEDFTPEGLKKENLRCVQWKTKESVWSESEDDNLSIPEGNNDIQYVQCNWKTTGYFAVQKRVAIKPASEGLSSGEIAGIAIGCVVAVGLIVGAIGFYMKSKNSKKAKKISEGSTASFKNNKVVPLHNENIGMGEINDVVEVKRDSL